MYINQAYKGFHEWWRYILGTLVIVMAVIIGQLPLTAAVFIKSMANGDSFMEMSETDLLGLLEPNLNLFLMLLTFAVGLLGIFLVAKYIHNQPLVALSTSRPKLDWKRFWFAFITWGIISVGFIFMDYFSNPDTYVLNFKPIPFLILCLVAIIMIPLQTSFEEYLFRGYFMQGIGVITKSKWIPLLTTSLVFGLLHITNPEVKQLGYIIMVYYIGTGLFLGIITLMDEGLELALGFHAANNLFTALLVTADWTAFQTHSIFKDTSLPETASFMEIFMPVFVVFPIITYVFSKKYKWHNWQDKLFGTVEEPMKSSSNLTNN
ncbi:CPBP family intramembrane glutamic endopeptidase [Bizionia sp. KMM 8389]